MKRQRGFTLVELLVVIAIIAILVSLLLPSMNRARTQALTVKCAANMQQIATAAKNYAMDNNDSWPPYRGFRGYAIRINGYPTQLNYTTAQDALPAPAGLNGGAGGADEDPTYALVMQNVSPGNLLTGASPTSPFPQYETCNLGRLYQTGYMANLNAAFDPALEPGGSPFAGGSTGSANWGPNTQYYSSYIFNPHVGYLPSIDSRANGNTLQLIVVASIEPNPGLPILYNPYASQSDLPANKCLAIDLVNNYNQMAHTQGNTMASVNMVFGDAHLATVTVPAQVIQYLMQINGQANLANIAASNTPGNADGTIANFPTNPNVYSSNWSFQWGIAATQNTTVNGIGTSLPLPSGLGSQGLPQQPNLDSYVDLFETLANGGNPRSLRSVAPPPNDQYWLYNGGQGRVTYLVPG
jgi:prepilin-type N-terminal cleavage/methylation domain-containing protein